jgi:hypothetical protein
MIKEVFDGIDIQGVQMADKTLAHPGDLADGLPQSPPMRIQFSDAAV